MGPIKRKIAIGVTNETQSGLWEGINGFFKSGTSHSIIPESVHTWKALIYDAKMIDDPIVTGIGGVVAYYMRHVNKTLSVLFSVPIDYNFPSNWWNAKVYPGKKGASYHMYKELYYSDPIKGDDKFHTKAIGEGFSVKGIMTSRGSCVLEVRIFQFPRFTFKNSYATKFC